MECEESFTALNKAMCSILGIGYASNYLGCLPSCSLHKIELTHLLSVYGDDHGLLDSLSHQGLTLLLTSAFAISSRPCLTYWVGSLAHWVNIISHLDVVLDITCFFPVL